MNNIETIFSNINDNLTHLKNVYNYSINSDIKIRNFDININNSRYSAFLMYIDGLVDSEKINRFILSSLMNKNISLNISLSNNNLEKSLYNNFIPENDLSTSNNFNGIISSINLGCCVLFIDKLSTCYIFDVKDYKQRNINTPTTELVINGSQEGFVEVLRTNTSILRRLVNNENLIIENLEIGLVSRTSCAICYIKGIANNDLVSAIKNRINNLKLNYLVSSGQLQNLIEDTPKSSLPQMVATERPDNAATYLLEGRIIIIVNGNPFVLVLPAVFIDFLNSAEDTNLKYQFANLLKLIRIIALGITVLLPGLYIAISYFHHELIPSELLFAIVSARNSVPFPIIFELLIMEISFELIREAGIRVPSPLGSTISLVGGIILGDAAVSAGIVSPISIIIVAITGISSFALPDYSLSFHFRIARFAYIFLGYFAGSLGIALGIFVHLGILSNLHSFGVPYLSPYSPPVKNINNDGYFETKRRKY